MALPADEPAPGSMLPLPGAAFQILVALADSDQHGYSIMREVSDRTNGAVKLNPGTLYTNIKRLLADGLIEELEERPDPEHDDERRRYYRLTRFGRNIAKAEAARLAQILKLAREAGLTPEEA